MGRQKKPEIKYCIEKGSPLPLGISIVGDNVNFAVETDAKKAEIVFYPRDKQEQECFTVEFPKEQKVGRVRHMSLSGICLKDYDYNYCADGEIFTDKRAARIIGREVWGSRQWETSDDSTNTAKTRCKPDYCKPAKVEKLRGGFFDEEFDWKGDSNPGTAMEDTVIYRMHVRGFTRDESSGVKNKGTFKGIQEKIPYLKSLGITYVELMPAYEFDEILKFDYPAYFADKTAEDDMPVNYWGYSDAYYFAPKQAYAAGDAVLEFKELVAALHKEGIELGMEFYFTPGTSKYFITDCLRHWFLNYHVDGFHINTEIAPADVIATDPLLATVKLFATDWMGVPNLNGNIARWDRKFMCDARRFLKGDEGMVESFIADFLDNPGEGRVVNFLADHNSFTVKDMVSYEKKYNEANGENNNDGENYNFSWNCGAEGETKKRKVLDCRIKQMKNAWVMLLCSQGIPMIMAGDEFGRTQAGNNNPYCQDNEISWLNWKLLRSNKVMFEFVKQLIEFRKANKILHMKKRLMQMDSMSCGYPDVSLHGIRAWYPDTEYYSRHTGLLFCGKYAGEQDYIYIAFNMYWEEQSMALPALESGYEWQLALKTDKGDAKIIEEDRKCNIPARSVCIFTSQKAAKTTKTTGMVKK